MEILMKKKPISIASRKAKGRNLQKWVCQQLSEVFGIPWGYEDEKDIQPRLMGQGGTDVVLRGNAVKCIPWSIECKAQEKLNVHDAIKQAKSNIKKGTNWLVVMKRNRETPVVVLDAEVFFDLILIHRNWYDRYGE